MTCGILHLGGCEDEDLGHDGPCTFNGVKNTYRLHQRHTRKLNDLKHKRSQMVVALSRLDNEIAAQEEKIAVKEAWINERNVSEQERTNEGP